MTPDLIKLFGSLDKITIDREGETKVTFCIPSSHLVKVQELTGMTEQPLAIDVRMA